MASFGAFSNRQETNTSSISSAPSSAVAADAVDQILKSAYNAQYLQASVQLNALEALMDPDNGEFVVLSIPRLHRSF